MKYQIFFLIFGFFISNESFAAAENKSPEANARVPSAVSAIAKITFTESEPYSCRILLRRIEDVTKGHAVLHSLIERIKKKKGWSEQDSQRVTSLISKIKQIPTEFHTSSIRVEVEWAVTDIWAQIFNAPGTLAVRWLFKGMDWQDQWGSLPDEVSSRWVPSEKKIKLTTNINAIQLCYGPSELQLKISPIGRTEMQLSLQSVVDWP